MLISYPLLCLCQKRVVHSPQSAKKNLEVVAKRGVSTEISSVDGASRLRLPRVNPFPSVRISFSCSASISFFPVSCEVRGEIPLGSTPVVRPHAGQCSHGGIYSWSSFLTSLELSSSSHDSEIDETPNRSTTGSMQAHCQKQRIQRHHHARNI